MRAPAIRQRGGVALMDAMSLLVADEMRNKRWPAGVPYCPWTLYAPRSHVHFDPEIEFLENLGKPADFLNMASQKTQPELLLAVQEKGYKLIQDEAGVSYAV